MVQLSTVKQQAPELVPTFMQVGKLLSSKGARQGTTKASVLFAADHSGSTEMGKNHLYTNREMHRVGTLAFAAGLFFDDDGKVPFTLFDHGVQPLGEVTMDNYATALDQHSQYQFGGTSYLGVLRWVIKEAGFERVNLRDRRLSVKATAPYPVYAAIATDGEPEYDNERDIIDLLVAMSQLPIFVQFIGVGAHSFRFLKQLDTLRGRLIDNAGFFDAKDADSQEKFLELMLSEFAASYIPNARRIGLIPAA